MTKRKKFQNTKKKSVWVSRLKIFAVAVLLVVLTIRLFMLIDWLVESPVSNKISLPGISYGMGSNYQLNIFVNPDTVYGFDPVEETVKYIRLDEIVDTSKALLAVKQRQIYPDAYLLFDESINFEGDLTSSLFQPILSNKVESNMTRWQLICLWWKLRNTHITVDDRASRILPESSIINEGLRVSVFNGTNVAGLAQESAAWVENVGAKVINVNNAENTQARSTLEVLLEDDSDYRTVQRLEQIFQAQAQYLPTDTKQREDIRVVVGQDYLR